MITKFPGTDEMSDGKDGAEKNADTADDDVCDTEEGVTTSHDGTGADDDRLGALVLVRREMGIDDDLVTSRFHSSAIVSLIELAKGR